MDTPFEVGIATAVAETREGGQLIDVREPWEYHAGHAPGARLLSLGELAVRARELPMDRRLLVICASGNRSLVAARALTEAGFDAVSVAGGMRAWQEAGHPVVSGDRLGSDIR